MSDKIETVDGIELYHHTEMGDGTVEDMFAISTPMLRSPGQPDRLDIASPQTLRELAQAIESKQADADSPLAPESDEAAGV